MDSVKKEEEKIIYGLQLDEIASNVTNYIIYFIVAIFNNLFKLVIFAYEAIRYGLFYMFMRFDCVAFLVFRIHSIYIYSREWIKLMWSFSTDIFYRIWYNKCLLCGGIGTCIK